MMKQHASLTNPLWFGESLCEERHAESLRNYCLEAAIIVKLLGLTSGVPGCHVT